MNRNQPTVMAARGSAVATSVRTVEEIAVKLFYILFRHEDGRPQGVVVRSYSGNAAEQIVVNTWNKAHDLQTRPLGDAEGEPGLLNNLPMPVDVSAAFHRAWGEAKDEPDYDKQAWIHVQKYVEG